MAPKSSTMDAGLIGYIFTGAAAGLAAGIINLLLWRHTIQHTRLLGIQLHSGFAHSIRQAIEDIPGKLDSSNFKLFEEKILYIFDEFMAKKLIEKMPVLGLFIDEKLIAEIRVIFRQEMEQHLPNLLKKNLVTEKNIETIKHLLRDAIGKGIRKYTRHLLLFLLVGAAAGALIGGLFGLLFN